MTHTRITYQGRLTTECRHESGSTFQTDAPKDNGGTGAAFSPTDLVGAALGSCILTLMGLAARKLQIDLTGTTADVEKFMATGSPRRIGKLVVQVRSPLSPSPEARAQLEAAGRTCPVHASLHPDIVQEIHFSWGGA